MATEFNDAAHWGFFMTGHTLTSSSGKYLRQSELTLAALRAAGILDNMVDGTAAPATDKLWLDKNFDPAVLKEWDTTGAAWVPVTFDRIFGRAIVTNMTVTGGTGDAIVVAQPTPFLSNRLYSLTPTADNTGAVTIQVTGVGNYNVRYPDGEQMAEQEFKAGDSKIVLFRNGRFEVLWATAGIYAALEAGGEAQAAAESAQAAAELARDEAEAFALAAQLRDPVPFAVNGNGTAGPYDIGYAIEADGALLLHISGAAQRVGVDFTFSGPNITFLTEIPLATDVIHGVVFKTRALNVAGEGTVSVPSLADDVKQSIPKLGVNSDVVDISRPALIREYFAARKTYPVKAFGNSLTAVGGGSAAVDTAAMNSGAASGDIVELTGATLQINDAIVVNTSSANFASIAASRVGSNAGSKLVVVDDALPKLFDVRQPNFEATGFFVECGSGNVATTLFHFERAPGSASDIDAVLRHIGHEGGAKVFHHYGRGLKLLDITSGNVKTCIGDVDWPTVWTPNGQSNDTQETGMRGHEFDIIRMHGAAAGIRNIGANRHNLRGLGASNWRGDIGVGGGGMFIGIPGVGSKFSNFVANIGAVIAGGLLDLWAGSKDASFLNMSCAGIKAGVTRLNRTAIIIRSTVADPSEDLKFIGGEIGPLNRYGVFMSGDGAMKNISFTGISFDRTNIEGAAYAPLFVELGAAFTEVTIKLSGCNFKFGAETAPTSILGGLDSSVVHLTKDVTTTKPAIIPWAPTNVIVT